MANSAFEVQKMYLAYFGRPADPVGLSGWMNSDAATMQNGFASSAEYATLYSGMTTEQRVNQVYQNLLGRPAETAGQAYWVNEFNAGRLNVGSLALAILNGAQGPDALTVQNRISYDTSFTNSLNTVDKINGYSGNLAAGNARIAVAAVTSDAASLTTALNNLPIATNAILSGISPAKAIADAAAADAAAAAAAAAAFTLAESSPTVTLTGSSTDAFVLSLVADTATRAGSSVTPSSGTLQASDISFTGSGYSGNETITAKGVAGSVETIVLGNGTNSVTFATADTTFSAGGFIDVVTGGTGADTLTLTAAAGAITATAAMLASVTNVETLTVTGNFAHSITTGASDAAMTTLNVNTAGATGVTVNAAGHAALTINTGSGADTITGTSNADTINGGAGNDTLTGGAGNDTFNITAGTDSITDLSGSDVLVISAGATVNATVSAAFTATAATLNNAAANSNAVLNTAGFDVDLSLVTGGTSGFTITGSTATGMTLKGSALADVITGGTGADTITGGAGNDTLTGNAGNDTFNVNAGTDTITDLSGSDVLVVSSGATANATVSAAFTATVATQNNAASNTNAVLSTAGFGVDLSLVTAGTSGFTINGSTATGMTLKGSGLADVISGGTGADTITGGAGNDTIVLGSDAAIDTVIFGATAAANGADTVTGFVVGAGGDVLNVNAFLGAAIDASNGATTLGVAIAGSLDLTGGGVNAANVLQLNDIQVLSAANFGAAASATVIKTAATSKYFVVADVTGDPDAIQNLYFVQTDGANAATVTLVGTMNEGTLLAANLA